MKNTQTLERYTSKSRFPAAVAVKTAPLALLALSAAAFADDANPAAALAQQAQTGMGGLVALLVAIVGIGIGIKVLWFGNKNVGKGINQAK